MLRKLAKELLHAVEEAQLVEHAEALGGLLGDGGADEPASMGGHEVDRLGGDLGGGADEVALVFAVFVIDDDDKPTKPDVGDEVFDGREFGHDGGARYGR